MQNIDSTSEKLFRLVRLLARYNRMQERDGGAFDKSRGQGRVLALLELKPGITQTELAYLLGVRNQSIGEMLAKLEKNELIQREASSEDKRVQTITLTDKGKDAAKGIKKNNGDKIFEILSEAEDKSFSDVLDKLIEGLEKELGTDEDFDADMPQHPHHPHIPHPPHMPRMPRMPRIRVIKEHIRKEVGDDIEIDLSDEIDGLDGFEDIDGESVKIIDERKSDGSGVVKKIIIKNREEF